MSAQKTSVAKGSVSPLRSNVRKNNSEAAITEGMDRLMAVVDHAVERIGNKNERRLVRDGVATVVRDTLLEIANEQADKPITAASAKSFLAAGATLGQTAQAGMNVGKQVQDLGFVQFTAGLITGTFDAIIGATIKQMEAFADLVSDLAKTLAQFQAENVSDAEINAHLAERYPDGLGGTVVRANFTFQDTAADPNTGAPAKTKTEKLQEVVDALKTATANLKTPATPLNLTVIAGADKFTASQITLIRAAIGALLATSMMDHLQAIAREGMARIVVTDGEILTRLTFNVTTTEVQTTQANQFHQDSAGAYINGGIRRRSWGVSGGASWNQFNVRTVNESTFDALTMSTQMIGQVNVKFRTQTFSPVVVNPPA